MSGDSNGRVEPTAQVRRVELSAEEKRVVLARDAQEWARDLTLVSTSGIFLLLSYTLAREGAWTLMAVALVIAVAAAAGFLYTWLPRRRRVTECEKEVIRGQVTRKRRTWGKRPIFYLYLGDCEVRVDREEWRRLRIGNDVELHRATLSDKAFAVYRHRPPRN